ncbi:MAG: hypothetical protein JXA77_06875 [Bacteroidales bacterium]|nr:hypothetical protein [Bacteroidales bacterium]MBN2819859.1 hypothetical protein [Bacteroidales bacterium]
MKRCLLIIVLAIPVLVFCQGRKELSFLHYTTEDGLSSSEVINIAQDKKGFIWIGTEDGLNRFDSYNFKVYRKKNNDSTSLSHNYISKLFTDSDGNLWIGTHQGLCLYNSEFDSFSNFYFVEGDFGHESNHISSIAENKNQKLFFGLQNGKLLEFDKKKGRLRELLMLESEIKFLFFDSENNLWALSDSIYLFNSEIKLIKTIYNPQVEYPYNNIVEDDDKFWISSQGGGLFWYNKNTKELVRSFNYDTYEDFINIIYKDKENNIWVGASNSLKLYDREKGIFHYYYYNEQDKNSLISSGIVSILQDKDGNYWVLSAKGGVNVSLVKKKFKTINTSSDYEFKLSKNIVSSLLADSKGKLWVGLYNAGIDKIDFMKNEIYQFDNIPVNNKSLGAGSVLMLYEDRLRNIWVGTYFGGLQKYNSQEKNFTAFFNQSNNSESAVVKDIRAITEDNEGIFWLATHGYGLDKFDPKSGSFKHYKQNKINNEVGLVNDWLFDVLCDYQGNIWAGSSYGLSWLDTENEKFTNFFHIPEDNSSLSNNFINCLFEDSNKNLWIGTNEGLNLFIRETKSFKSYFQKDGLPNNVIKGILEDKNGCLWISTNMGIAKFDLNTESFRNYDINDGLPSNEYYPRACSKDNKGSLYFGGNNGVVYFDPDSIIDNKNLPTVYITNFKLSNKSVSHTDINSPLEKSIIQTHEIVLDHKQALVITFEYASLSFTQSDKKQYAYIMEGFDKDWVYCGTRREVTYTNLDPGQYIFRVKASNQDNIWNEEGSFVEITILPPWWQTLGFKILVALIFITLFIVFYLFKLSSLHSQKLQLEQTVAERTKEIKEKNESLLILNATKDKFFTILAHDLKNPFNSILGISEILSKKFDTIPKERLKILVDSIYTSSDSVYKLLENLLQWSRSQTGAIKYEPEEFSLFEVIRTNILLEETRFEEKGIKLNLDVPEDIIVYADKNMTHTVIRNLLSNAVKFIEKGQITITVVIRGDFAKLSINDTGIGMSKEKLNSLFIIGESNSDLGTRGETGTGLGLLICKEFVTKNKGELTVESEINKGSNFSFTIPLKK